MSEEDKRIREKLKQKDIDMSKELQKEMKMQEDMLKNYFKEYKKPTKDDPTVVKKKKKAEQVDKKELAKQVFKPFRLFTMFHNFWNMQCATPEQRYALKIAKDNIKLNVLKCIAGSLLITTLTSYKMRMYMTKPLHIFGFCTALASGTFLGIINSTQFTLEQFEKLGDGYQLGRMAIAEIQKFRMDKNI